VVRAVEVGHVECDVPVALAQRGLARCARLAARPGTGPVQQLEPVAVHRVNEHLDAQIEGFDPERELRRQPDT
jgi:hypothetical protein